MSISVMLRLVPEALADGRLAGEVEIVATGQHALVANAEEIVRFITSESVWAAGTENDH